MEGLCSKPDGQDSRPRLLLKAAPRNVLRNRIVKSTFVPRLNVNNNVRHPIEFFPN